MPLFSGALFGGVVPVPLFSGAGVVGATLPGALFWSGIFLFKVKEYRHTFWETVKLKIFFGWFSPTYKDYLHTAIL